MPWPEGAQRALANRLALRARLRVDSALGRIDGHQSGENVAAIGQNRWPPLGRNQWPLTGGVKRVDQPTMLSTCGFAARHDCSS
jgi:hypothetical protein